MRSVRPSALSSALAFGLAVGVAHAQCTPEWLPGQVVPGLNGDALAAASWDPDGSGPQQELLVIGGRFSTVGQVGAANIAAWNGTAWLPLGTELGTAGSSVDALIVYNGELIAAGRFNEMSGQEPEFIVRWTGSAWAPVGSNLGPQLFHYHTGGFGGPPGPVITSYVGVASRLTVYDGQLIACGYFIIDGGTEASNLARWDGSTWHAIPGIGGSVTGSGPEINALAVYNGELIVGGVFTLAGAQPVNHIARWNGAGWQPLGSGVGGVSYPTVHALAVHAGQLIVGGTFTTAGGQSAMNVARWNGSGWQALGAGLGIPAVPYNPVLAFAVYNGELVAGGEFSTSAGQPVKFIARWTGSSWAAIGTGASGPVQTLTVHGGDLIAGGWFHAAGGTPASHVARWDGSSWHALLSGLAPSGPVRAFAMFNGDLIAGGSFLTAGGHVVKSVARRTGQTWAPLGGGLGLNNGTGTVHAMTVHDAGLVVGGYFTTAGGQPATSIARWTGSAWVPVGGGVAWSGGPGTVNAATVYNGDLIAGGFFNSAGGVSAKSIARWDGAAWHALASGANGYVWALAVFGSELIAGGSFSVYNAGPGDNIARWNGSTWQPLGTGLSAPVDALAVLNGNLFAGGWFLEAGGQSAKHVARWNGAFWSKLGAGTDERVRALVAHQGVLFAGGDFINAGSGQPENHIARWNGQQWEGLESGVNDSVFALGVDGDMLVAGGEFTTVGGQPSHHWARWGCPTPPCYPDCNADGALTVADFGCFQTQFVLGDPYADCNADGVLTVADFGCFQTKFVLGCP